MAIIQRMMPDAIRWYDQNVSDVSRRYESVAAETVHGWLVDLLPNAPVLILDVGAGTGGDGAFLLKAWGRELSATTRCPAKTPPAASPKLPQTQRLEGIIAGYRR
jgi:hypothetical protein